MSIIETILAMTAFIMAPKVMRHGGMPGGIVNSTAGDNYLLDNSDVILATPIGDYLTP